MFYLRQMRGNPTAWRLWNILFLLSDRIVINIVVISVNCMHMSLLLILELDEVIYVVVCSLNDFMQMCLWFLCRHITDILLLTTLFTSYFQNQNQSTTIQIHGIMCHVFLFTIMEQIYPFSCFVFWINVIFIQNLLLGINIYLCIYLHICADTKSVTEDFRCLSCSDMLLPWQHDTAGPGEVTVMSFWCWWRKSTSYIENEALGYVNNSTKRIRWKGRWQTLLHIWTGYTSFI